MSADLLQRRAPSLADAPRRPLRILLSLYHAGYLRHYGEPVRLLAARGHSVHLVVGQVDKDEGDARLLERLLEECPTVSASLASSDPAQSGWRRIAWFVRGMADYSRYADPRFAEATALRRRIREHVTARFEAQRLDPFTRRVVRRLLERLGSSSDAELSRRWVRRFALLEQAIPPSRATLRLLRSFRPDAVLASPVVEIGSEQVEFLKAARHLGIPAGVCVSSWDNLTNKGLIRTLPERVIVWNEDQVTELEELHGVPRERAVVTGAQRYDEWFVRSPSRSRAEFGRRVGVDLEQPLLLYVCSSAFIAPAEVPFVLRWLEAVRGAAGRLGEAAVLVRPHPQNAAQWLDVDLSAFGNAAIWPRGGRMPDEEEDRADYFDSFAHSAAVVGINTSALIEAAVVGRATYTVLAPEFEATQEGTLHFRYLRAEHGGVVHVASNLREHVLQLAAAIDDPDADQARAHAFVSRFVRPWGRDVTAAPLVAAAAEELAEVAPDHAPHRLARLLLRPPLAVAAAIVSASSRRASDVGERTPIPLRRAARTTE
jgi:hypothetical protein